jgi:pyruvate,water dikinase
MIVPLTDAEAGTSGGKAGALAVLLRAGLPVPDGFVVPFGAYREVVYGLKLSTPEALRQAIVGRPLDAWLLAAIAAGLETLGHPHVAVRSSAAGEDTAHASAAGQHETVLAAQGIDQVARAIRVCWASLHSPRAIEYRRKANAPEMAVLIQRHVDAEISGVMFTPPDPGGPTEIEASWGLGPSVAGGTVTPDAFRVSAGESVHRTISAKRTRLDRRGAELITRDVPEESQNQPTLDAPMAIELARLGLKAAEVLGGALDIEWAIADGRIWLLQARPVTAALPTAAAHAATPSGSLNGTPGSQGIVTGTARIILGPNDFSRVRPGDILVCPYTDPSWTPLLRIAAGVVTETGGVLSHAAIVARELRIPAVLGVPNATTRIPNGTNITIDGATGVVTKGN